MAKCTDLCVQDNNDRNESIEPYWAIVADTGKGNTWTYMLVSPGLTYTGYVILDASSVDTAYRGVDTWRISREHML